MTIPDDADVDVQVPPPPPPKKKRSSTGKPKSKKKLDAPSTHNGSGTDDNIDSNGTPLPKKKKKKKKKQPSVERSAEDTAHGSATDTAADAVAPPKRRKSKKPKSTKNLASKTSSAPSECSDIDTDEDLDLNHIVANNTGTPSKPKAKKFKKKSASKRDLASPSTAAAAATTANASPSKSTANQKTVDANKPSPAGLSAHTVSTDNIQSKAPVPPSPAKRKATQSQRLQPHTYHGPSTSNVTRPALPPPPGTRRASNGNGGSGIGLSFRWLTGNGSNNQKDGGNNNNGNSGDDDDSTDEKKPSSLLNMRIFGSSVHTNSGTNNRTLSSTSDEQQRPQSMRIAGNPHPLGGRGRGPSGRGHMMMARGGRGGRGPGGPPGRGGRGRGPQYRVGAQSMMNLGNRPGIMNNNMRMASVHPPEQSMQQPRRPPSSILRNSNHQGPRPPTNSADDVDGGGRSMSPTNSIGSQSGRVNPDGSIATPSNAPPPPLGGNMPMNIGSGHPRPPPSLRNMNAQNSLHNSAHMPGTSTRYMSQFIRRKKDPPRPGLMAGLSGLDMSSHHVRSSPEGARILDMSNHSLENNSGHRRSLMLSTGKNNNASTRSTMSYDQMFEDDPLWKQALRYIRILPPHPEEKPIKRKVRIMTWLALVCDLTAAVVSLMQYNEVTTCCGRPVMDIAAAGVNWNRAIQIATVVYIVFIFLEVVPVVREGLPFNLLNPLVGFLITFAVFFDDGIAEATAMWCIEATAVILEFLTYRCHIQQFKDRAARLKAVELDLKPFQERRRRKREISMKNLRRSQKILNGEPLSSSDESSSDDSGSDSEFASINDNSRRSTLRRKLSKGDMSALSTGSSIHEGNFRDEDASGNYGSEHDLTQVRELTLLRERRIYRQRQGEETKTLRYHFVGVCVNVSLSSITFLLIVFIARSGGLCIRDFDPPNIFARDQLGEEFCYLCKENPSECAVCDGDSIQCYFPYDFA